VEKIAIFKTISPVAQISLCRRYWLLSSHLGMDRNRFNAEVRPHVTEIPIGSQGVAFDRLDLDAWANDYKSRNGRPGQSNGDSIWDANERRGTSKKAGSGTSRSRSTGTGLAKVMERLDL